jgi:2'-5' RNA ligase
MARIFVATRLPIALVPHLAAIQDALDRRLVDVKWVEPENLHLTLRFFGELDSEAIGRVERVVTEVTRTGTPFTIRLEGIGAFPPRGRPRVIWVGMSRGAGDLTALALRLEQAFVAHGLGGTDRPFAPHLTLGRVREPRAEGPRRHRGPRPPAQATAAMQTAIADARFEPADFEVSEVAVVESQLSPGGPTYSNRVVTVLGQASRGDRSGAGVSSAN